MIVLHSGLTGLKGEVLNVDDLADYMRDYRVTARRERDASTAYEIEPMTHSAWQSLIIIDRDEHDALLMMDDLTLIRQPSRPGHQLRPTPERTDR